MCTGNVYICKCLHLLVLSWPSTSPGVAAVPAPTGYWREDLSRATTVPHQETPHMFCSIAVAEPRDWEQRLQGLEACRQWPLTTCMNLNKPFHCSVTAAAAKSLQSCDPIDGSPSGSPIPGILQAGTLEWVAISFSSAWKWKVKGKSLSHVRLFRTPWTAAYQAPPSMGFSRQEYWNGLPSPSPQLLC